MLWAGLGDVAVITTRTKSSIPSSLELGDVVRAVERGENNKKRDIIQFSLGYKQPSPLSKALRRVL